MNYLVIISCERTKIFLIKCVRAINGWGLKDSKDWVEDNFTFDNYMNNQVEFEITVTAEQLGRLTHFSLSNHNMGRVFIKSSTTVAVDKRNMFDFTKSIF